MCRYYSGTKPSEEQDPEKLREFCEEQGLKNGDVLNFGEGIRDCGCLIVMDNENGLKMVINPDETSAGYLTIPKEVLEFETNAVKKYASMAMDPSRSRVLNLHLSPKDRFVTKRLGASVPGDWEFDVYYEDESDKIQGLSIKVPGGKWYGFDADKVTLEEVEAFVAGQNQEQAKLEVKVNLEGDKYLQYKTKYTQGKKKMSWMLAEPKLPKTWKIEKGVSGVGPTSTSWEWRLNGPSNQEQEVKEAVETFLSGFGYNITKS